MVEIKMILIDLITYQSILALLFLVFAGIAKAFLDLSSENLLISEFWDKGYGWKYKWKNGNPALGERFLGSSTIFVFVTDGWHLLQFLMLRFFYLSVAVLLTTNILIIMLLTFVILPMPLALGFNPIYEYLKTNR